MPKINDFAPADESDGWNLELQPSTTSNDLTHELENENDDTNNGRIGSMTINDESGVGVTIPTREVQQDDENIDALENQDSTTSTDIQFDRVPLKKNDVVTFRTNSGEWKRAIITSRAGKSTGKYRNSWNVKLDNGDEM